MLCTLVDQFRLANVHLVGYSLASMLPRSASQAVSNRYSRRLRVSLAGDVVGNMVGDSSNSDKSNLLNRAKEKRHSKVPF
jgi:hypothetical protein